MPQDCLQWGQPNLVDPAQWPEIGLLNRDLGAFVEFYLGDSKTQSSSPDPPMAKFAKVKHFFGIGPDPVQGWPFTLRGGCGAELPKLPQWFVLLAVAGTSFRKMRCGN